MRWTPDVMIQRPEVEADDRASVVHQKANQPWIGIAMDATSRQVMAVQVGERRRKRATRLWAKMPHASRQHARCDPDQYVGYEGVLPAVQHRAICTWARTTNHRERFNTTLRQRVSRLVREALSCSKKPAPHSGAIKRFICHDNLTSAAA
jgi:insertion element IS1 protein InsB